MAQDMGYMAIEMPSSPNNSAPIDFSFAVSLASSSPPYGFHSQNFKRFNIFTVDLENANSSILASLFRGGLQNQTRDETVLAAEYQSNWHKTEWHIE